MRICFVSREGIYTRIKELEGVDADLIIGGFKSLGEVSYERELREETNYFEQVADVSRQTGPRRHRRCGGTAGMRCLRR